MRLYRNAHGNLTAESEYPVPTTPPRTLRILTIKTFSGELATNVICGVADEHFFTYAPFSDFSRNLERTRERCTEKNVTAAQARGEAQAEVLVAAAVEFYKTKENLS